MDLYGNPVNWALHMSRQICAFQPIQLQLRASSICQKSGRSWGDGAIHRIPRLLKFNPEFDIQQGIKY